MWITDMGTAEFLTYVALGRKTGESVLRKDSQHFLAPKKVLARIAGLAVSTA